MIDKLGIEPAAPEPLGDSEGTATQVVAGLEPVAYVVQDYTSRTLALIRHKNTVKVGDTLYSAADVAKLQADLAAMTQERDEWKRQSSNNWNSAVQNGLLLAASQAREKQLREALEICKKEMQGDKWDALYIDGVLAWK